MFFVFSLHTILTSRFSHPIVNLDEKVSQYLIGFMKHINKEEKNFKILFGIICKIIFPAGY